jgi:hypothetical protein
LQEVRARQPPAAAWDRFSEARRWPSASYSFNRKLRIHLSQSWERPVACSSETWVLVIIRHFHTQLKQSPSCYDASRWNFCIPEIPGVRKTGIQKYGTLFNSTDYKFSKITTFTKIAVLKHVKYAVF